MCGALFISKQEISKRAARDREPTTIYLLRWRVYCKKRFVKNMYYILLAKVVVVCI